MKASDLIDNLDILKKIEKLEADLQKFVDAKKSEIAALTATLPPAIKNMLLDEPKDKATRSISDKRERVTLSADDKTHIRDAAKDVLKKAKDGARFSEIMAGVQKAAPTIRFKDTHLRGILQNEKSFVMKGEKINALWYLK